MTQTAGFDFVGAGPIGTTLAELAPAAGLERIRENLGAADVNLTEDEFDRSGVGQDRDPRHRIDEDIAKLRNLD